MGPMRRPVVADKSGHLSTEAKRPVERLLFQMPACVDFLPWSGQWMSGSLAELGRSMLD